MEKAVVLLSGGLDSTTLAYYLVKLGYEIWPLSINYGQTHKKEIVAARNICEDMGIVSRQKIVNLDVLKNILPSTLTGVGAIPEGIYNEPSMSQTVVPGRNLIFLAVAAGYAQGIGATTVAYAAHAGDHFIYPDCRPEFAYAAADAIKRGYDIDLLFPFMQKTKSDIVKLGISLNVPYWKTWSCYKGGDLHCGKCGTCDERKKAFTEAGVKDSTEYEKSS